MKSRATLGLCLVVLGGCATSRWVDAVTPGDLWGTGGREMGLITWLRATSPDRSAPDETSSEAAVEATLETLRDEALLDAMIELVFTGLSVW